MSTISNLQDALADLAESAKIAEPFKRGGGSGGGRVGRTPEELIAMLSDPVSAPDVRTWKGSSGELTDNQIAAVILSRGSVGGGAFAISYQARNYPEATPDVLARLAIDYSTNRNGAVSGTTLAIFEACDTQYEISDPVEFCKLLIPKEPACYSAAQKLETLGVPFELGETEDEEPAAIAKEQIVDETHFDDDPTLDGETENNDELGDDED